MAALLFPLDDLFATLRPIASGWLLPAVFASMTVSVASLIERHGRLVGLPPVGPLRGPVPAPVALAREPASTIDLHAAMAEAIASVREEAERKKVSLELAIPGRLVVYAESYLLRPVLQVLLRNAVAHAPGGCVFIGAMRVDGCVQIIVIDDGRATEQPIAVALRAPLARLLARSGAGLVIDHRPGDGMTVVLSLPDKD